MGYPDKLLNPGERVAVDVVPHWKFLTLPALTVAIVLAGAIVALQAQLPGWADLAIAGVMVVCVLWLVRRYLRWVTTSFVVTNQRLIMRKGVFRRSGRENPYRPFDGHYLQTDPHGPAATQRRPLARVPRALRSGGPEGPAPAHQDPERNMPPGQPSAMACRDGQMGGWSPAPTLSRPAGLAPSEPAPPKPTPLELGPRELGPSELGPSAPTRLE